MKETFLKTVMEGAGIGRKKAEYLWQIGVRLPAEQHQGDAIGTLVRDYNERIVFTPIGDPRIIDDMKVYTHADPGEVERLRAELAEMTGYRNNGANEILKLHDKLAELREGIAKHWKVVCDQRAQLAEAMEFVDAFKSGLGASWESCDKHGKPVWNRIQSLQDRVAGVSICRTPSGCECPGDGVGRCKRCPFASAEPSAPKDWCSTMERPKSKCGCPDCGSSIVQIGEPSAPVERDERAEFEAFFEEKAKTLPLLRGATTIRYAGGQYVNDWALFGNIVWQARAALERKP